MAIDDKIAEFVRDYKTQGNEYDPVFEFRSYLERKNLSMNQFAKSIGEEPARISEIVSMRSRPNPRVVLKIFKETGINPLSLIMYYEIDKAKKQLNKILSE